MPIISGGTLAMLKFKLWPPPNGEFVSVIAPKNADDEAGTITAYSRLIIKIKAINGLDHTVFP